jgi:hypothetical protein
MSSKSAALRARTQYECGASGILMLSLWVNRLMEVDTIDQGGYLVQGHAFVKDVAPDALQ